jgi:hypothetical protein
MQPHHRNEHAPSIHYNLAVSQLIAATSDTAATISKSIVTRSESAALEVPHSARHWEWEFSGAIEQQACQYDARPANK